MSGEPMVFLGLDSSTQGLKALAVDAEGRPLFEKSVSYDRDLPKYRTEGGVHRHPDGRTVTAPPIMWAEALDLLFERMADERFPFGQVAAVSVSGQQHGSVYWRRGAGLQLGRLENHRPIAPQLAETFAVEESPIWMDSSTTEECREREAAMGGAQALAEITGSRAYERFTGNQIARIAKRRPEAYAATERISLVSSFMATLLAGAYAPIDWSDGSGMNLLDIRAKRWDPKSLAVTAPGLAERLGEPVPSHSSVGGLASYWRTRYGFSDQAMLIAASGDNPCSLAGLGLRQPGDVAISLGTSDTLFAALCEPRPSGREGHIFVNPVDPDGYMALLCWKNGSLTREAIRKLVGDPDWRAYAVRLGRTEPGNGGRIGFYFLEPEITPPCLQAGVHRFGPDDRPAIFTPDEEARAVLEGAFLSMRLHAEGLGIRPVRLLATGGASVDPTVLRVMADVFGVRVEPSDVPNTAALGAALRAWHGWRCWQAGQFISYDAIWKQRRIPSPGRGVDPDPTAHARYTALLRRYAALERRVLESAGAL